MGIQTDLSKLLDMLKARPIVTAKEARECGIQSPGARARELAEHGYSVVPCWQLLDTQKLERPAVTERGKSKKSKSRRSSPRKNSKPTRQAIAAELKRARAALEGAE
jgi:hypothetical protein